MRLDTKEFLMIAAFFVGVLMFLSGIVIVHSKLEVAAFERATGKHVEWTDAIFLELRVDGD